jgi:hypothetical protein
VRLVLVLVLLGQLRCPGPGHFDRSGSLRAVKLHPSAGAGHKRTVCRAGPKILAAGVELELVEGADWNGPSLG